LASSTARSFPPHGAGEWFGFVIIYLLFDADLMPAMGPHSEATAPMAGWCGILRQESCCVFIARGSIMSADFSKNPTPLPDLIGNNLNKGSKFPDVTTIRSNFTAF
jgi:hypothetical protein